MIRATKQAGLEVLLITNGSLLTEAMCEELVEVGVDTINISLNVAREESHTRPPLRPGPATSTASSPCCATFARRGAGGAMASPASTSLR